MELTYQKLLQQLKERGYTPDRLSQERCIVAREAHGPEHAELIPTKVDVVFSGHPNYRPGQIVFDGTRARAGLPIRDENDMYNGPQSSFPDALRDGCKVILVHERDGEIVGVFEGTSYT